ncbi:hypothetical protein [Lysobacter fragariae]
MSFKHLITRVRRAEDVLEAHQRRTVAHWQQLTGTWKAAWTPGRLVIAGLAVGWMFGRANPLRRLARGGDLIQVFTALSGFFSSVSAQAAASEASNAAHAAEEVAEGQASMDASIADSTADEAIATASTARHAGRSG